MNASKITEEQRILIQEHGISDAVWITLKSSVFPGAKDESIMLAVEYCKARGLDVLKKPCHIVPMNVRDSKTDSYGWRDVIMPGIYEQRITAIRTEQYVGQDAPVFGPVTEFKFGGQTVSAPEWCTVTVYRYMNETRVPFQHTEYFDECAATKKDGRLNSMWSRRKRGQISKCAEAGALRKAFPDELGGIMTDDEMTNINSSYLTTSDIGNTIEETIKSNGVQSTETVDKKTGEVITSQSEKQLSASDAIDLFKSSKTTKEINEHKKLIQKFSGKEKETLIVSWFERALDLSETKAQVEKLKSQADKLDDENYKMQIIDFCLEKLDRFG